MAFTETFLPYSRQKYFYYYASTVGTAGLTMTETLNLSNAFEICDIRLHISAVHQSTESFVVTLNANAGSPHDVIIVDWSAESKQDYVWRPSTTPMIFPKGDLLSFVLILSHVDSGKCGLTVTGWEITV